MRSTTSRKGQTSITHLMNFSLPPRPQHQPTYHRNPRRYASWGYHAVDKARYVHANYRFIVTPDRNYHAQAANADVHLDWNSVLQVLVSAQTQDASCPICLSTPVAPRMARCGHVFCLPCLIRYMHSTDEESQMPEKRARWKKCPICWDAVYMSEVRPVRWYRGQEGDLPIENGDVVLRLVKREPGNTLALPRDGAESLGRDDDIPWYHAAEVADYARMMKGGEDYMHSQYDSEITALRAQEAEDELMFGDDTTWTQKAVAAITEAKEKVKGIGNPPDLSRQPISKRPSRDPIAPGPPQDATASAVAQNDVQSGQNSAEPTAPSRTEEESQPGPSNEASLPHAMNSIQLESGDGVHSKHNGAPKAPQGAQAVDQPYYFYQALPQFYLSPLDIRILKTAFGDYSLFPATILPRVEHISTGHMVDDELRKRVKYLGHLPFGCEVNFLECDWRDVVGPAVLQQFHTDIQKRRKRNKEKEVREEKDRVRAEKEEDDKRWAAARRKRPSISDSSIDPPFSDRDFQPLTGVPSLDEPSTDAGPSTSPPRAASGFNALASPSTSPGSRTVWGTAAVPSLAQEDAPPALPINDGWRQGWEDELLAQQESEAIAQSTTEGQGPTAGGKKKKKNKITLMSTNSQRGA